MAGTFLRRLGAWVGGFDAGLANRRLRGFRPARAHVNALLAAAGPDMNARARYLVRNNGYAQGALDSWAANTVGTGVKPSSLIAAPARKAALQRLWQDWTDEADAEGVTDFYGLQRRIAREFFLTGECFVRLRARRPGDGLAVPLQLQCLPSEMLPIGRTEALGGGRAIRQGIEFDAVGRRVAYHFHRRHPGDPTEPGLAGETVRVPAEDVLHIVDPVESGQLRGVSRFAPAIVKLFLLDQYDDAELDRKKVAAMYAMFITSNDPDAAPLEGELGDQVAPGQIVRLDPGEDMKVADPADSGATYEPFQYRTLLQVSAALGIPYAHLSQDMVKANYSNARRPAGPRRGLARALRRDGRGRPRRAAQPTAGTRHRGAGPRRCRRGGRGAGRRGLRSPQRLRGLLLDADADAVEGAICRAFQQAAIVCLPEEVTVTLNTEGEQAVGTLISSFRIVWRRPVPRPAS